jgi:hypothetical protein
MMQGVNGTRRSGGRDEEMLLASGQHTRKPDRDPDERIERRRKGITV